MSLHPDSYQDYLARKKRQDKRRRESVQKYRDKRKKRALEKGEYSSLNPVNPERRRKRFKHHYGSEDRAEFFSNQACDSCGREPTDEHPSHNHHVRTGGMGTKAHHRWIIPLCSDCHRAMHGKDPPMGPETAQAQAEYWAGRWEAERDG